VSDVDAVDACSAAAISPGPLRLSGMFESHPDRQRPGTIRLLLPRRHRPLARPGSTRAQRRLPVGRRSRRRLARPLVSRLHSDPVAALNRLPRTSRDDDRPRARQLSRASWMAKPADTPRLHPRPGTPARRRSGRAARGGRCHRCEAAVTSSRRSRERMLRRVSGPGCRSGARRARGRRTRGRSGTAPVLDGGRRRSSRAACRRT